MTAPLLDLAARATADGVAVWPEPGAPPTLGVPSSGPWRGRVGARPVDRFADAA